MLLNFDLFFILVSTVPFVLIITIMIIFFMAARKQRHNVKLPRLTVYATVVAKRIHHSHSKNSSGFSYYYVTFEVESTDRFELSVPSTEFGYLVEGDQGKLTFQGNSFLEFKRCTNE